MGRIATMPRLKNDFEVQKEMQRWLKNAEEKFKKRFCGMEIAHHYNGEFVIGKVSDYSVEDGFKLGKIVVELKDNNIKSEIKSK